MSGTRYPKCPECGYNGIYHEAHESWACIKCNIWLEPKCMDWRCTQCKTRPTLPLSVRAHKAWTARFETWWKKSQRKTNASSRLNK